MQAQPQRAGHRSHQPFDLIIVGAGINGAGIARDAALRGLHVLLLDKSGIGSGTTSYATRLIHGGLRYLEHYEIPLVRESLHEREVLLRIAPHLVHPLPFLIPIYQGGKRGPGMLRLGMIAYDVLSFDKSLANHTMLNREEALRREPGLDPNGLEGAALYYDAQVEFPERLALENALSAHENGSTIRTYAQVERFLRNGNRVEGVQFTDLLTGEQHEARAPITINASGPWLDELMSLELGGQGEKMIGGTKGSHIIVQPFPGAPKEALYVEARSNGRPYFIVPWNDLYLIGTTDLRYTDSLDRIVPDEEEIEYLVRETNAVIPDAELTRESVLYSYAGVRPLPYQSEGSESGITRRHIIRDHSLNPASRTQAPASRAPAIEGLISIIGGKLTTYRNLAQQAVDMVYRKLGRTPPACATARIPLPGARTADYRAFERHFHDTSGLPAGSARQMLRVYGTRSYSVLSQTDGHADLQAPFDQRGALGAEIPFSFEQEFAVTLTDVLMRCTMVGWDPDAGIGPDLKAAEISQRYVGWTGEEAERQVAAYRDYVARYKPRILEGA